MPRVQSSLTVSPMMNPPHTSLTVPQWITHTGLTRTPPPSLAWSCFSWIPTLRCDHVSLMEPSTLVLGIPVTLILLVGAQAAVLGTILVVQLHVLIAAVRTIHSIIWLSVLWLGIFYSVYYGYVLCRLLQTGWSECRDIYTPTLLCSAWMFTFLVLDKNLEKTSVNYLLTIFLVGLSTLFIAWEYHYSNIETRSDLGDFPLFCPTSRDLLHTFVHEYLVLYLPVTAIGLVQRSRSSKDPNNCSCHECTHWKKTGGRMLRWYACALLVIRPAHFYYCFTLDYNYSDMLMYFVNFLSFLYLFLKTKTFMSKQKYGENKGKTMSSVVQLNSCCET